MQVIESKPELAQVVLRAAIMRLRANGLSTTFSPAEIESAEKHDLRFGLGRSRDFTIHCVDVAAKNANS